MKKLHLSWFIATLLLALLSGCATTPVSTLEKGVGTAELNADMKLIGPSDKEKSKEIAPKPDKPTA
jgi:hypothetical protein